MPEEITSIELLSREVEKLSKIRDGKSLIYRGHGAQSFKLLPMLAGVLRQSRMMIKQMILNCTPTEARTMPGAGKSMSELC